MQISTKTLMHIYNTCILYVIMQKKTCSYDKKHESIVFTSVHNSVWNSFVVVSLVEWNYFNAMIVMIMMTVVH